MSVYVMKEIELGLADQYYIGENKIGGYYLPADTQVKIVYNNNGQSTNTIISLIEYLY